MIVAIGDSITAAQGLHPFEAWPYRMQPPITGAGVPSDTTRLGLERFPRDVQERRPDIVVIQFGHNDANRWLTDRGLPRVSPDAYRANLIEMVDRCRAFDAKPFLCTLTPTTKSEQLAKDVARYDEILRDVARDTETPLIDVRSAFLELADPVGYGETSITTAGLLLEDGLHLSVRGQELYARTVAQVLLSSFL